MEPVKNFEKGICIVATGHPYYGRFAYNLACSIKAMENFPICVLYNGQALKHLDADQLEVFDYVIHLSDEIKAEQMCKLHVADHTPFEKTLLLDADMLWLQKRKPSDLFSEVEGQHFASITEGKESDPNKGYFFWADTGEIKQKYDCKAEIYQWRSEVVYFDEVGAAILRRALEICKKPDLNSVMHFAHSVPDELGINIAMAEAGLIPHQYKWMPSYWPNINGGAIVKWGDKLNSEHYLFSFGSNTANGDMKKTYGQICQTAMNVLRRQNIFPLIEKRSFLPQIRNKM